MYTFNLVTDISKDEIFDRLYSDSLDSLESGTVVFASQSLDEDMENTIHTLLTQGGYENEKIITISRDNSICMYIQGWIKDNTLVWNNALVGKINNSKSWCASQQFHTENKEWIESQGCTAWEVHCLKDSRIETFFKAVNDSGNMLGTFSERTDNGTYKMRWEF